MTNSQWYSNEDLQGVKCRVHACVTSLHSPLPVLPLPHHQFLQWVAAESSPLFYSIVSLLPNNTQLHMMLHGAPSEKHFCSGVQRLLTAEELFFFPLPSPSYLPALVLPALRCPVLPTAGARRSMAAPSSHGVSFS